MHLEAGVQKFLTEVHPRFLSRFTELAVGQNPHTLFICCSDSRLVSNVITQTEPGELFEMSNAGQIIAKMHEEDLSSQGTIEFALNALAIKNIVICGHSDCGAVKKLCELSESSANSMENTCSHSATLRFLQKAYPTGITKASSGQLSDTICLHVRTQCENLLTYPNIQEGINSGELKLYGWFYDIGSGNISEVARYGDFVDEKKCTI